MAKNEIPGRRLKGYYKFSKKYPSRRGETYAIGESRKMRKKERARKILLVVLLCCVFVFAYVAAMFCHNLMTRPIPQPPAEETPIITPDNIGTIRAIYIENKTLADMSDLSDSLRDAKKNGFNAVMLDFKTSEGYLAYKSKRLKNSGTGNNVIIDDVIIEKIKQEDLMIIARIFCFEDAVAPQRLGAFVYEDAERTKMWFDAPAVNGGKPWLNPTAPAAVDYLCSIVGEVATFGADAVYLESVQFPEPRVGTALYFTEDDSTLNRNLVLLNFIERAQEKAGDSPVIIGTPLEGAEGGSPEKWGGNLFDTAAPICSPLLLKPDDGDYVEYTKNKYITLNENAKNNFSTIKIIPTVKNQADDTDFYEKMASSGADSYIIIP